MGAALLGPLKDSRRTPANSPVMMVRRGAVLLSLALLGAVTPARADDAVRVVTEETTTYSCPSWGVNCSGFRSGVFLERVEVSSSGLVARTSTVWIRAALCPRFQPCSPEVQDWRGTPGPEAYQMEDGEPRVGTIVVRNADGYPCRVGTYGSIGGPFGTPSVSRSAVVDENGIMIGSREEYRSVYESHITSDDCGWSNIPYGAPNTEHVYTRTVYFAS